MRDQDILFIALGLGAVAFFATQKGTPEKPVLVSPFDPPPWRPQGLTKAQQADVMEWDVPDVVKKGKGGDNPQQRADEAIRVWISYEYTTYRASVDRQIMLFYEAWQANTWPVRQNVHDDLHCGAARRRVQAAPNHVGGGLPRHRGQQRVFRGLPYADPKHNEHWAPSQCQLGPTR